MELPAGADAKLGEHVAQVVLNGAELMNRRAPISGFDTATLEALNDCTQACVADSDCDLGEQNVIEMVTCIRLCRCLHRYRRGPKPPGGVRPQSYRAAPWVCAVVCKSCRDECERHARMHEHCRVCAEACRRCEQACRELLDAIK